MLSGVLSSYEAVLSRTVLVQNGALSPKRKELEFWLADNVINQTDLFYVFIGNFCNLVN